MDKDVYIYFTNTDTGLTNVVEVGNISKPAVTEMIRLAKDTGDDLVLKNTDKDIIVDFNTLMTSIIQVVLMSKEELNNKIEQADDN